MTNVCYLVGENDGLIGPLLGSWQDAEDACVAMGPNTHLASIHTAEENAFLVGKSLPSSSLNNNPGLSYMTGSLLGPLMMP